MAECRSSATYSGIFSAAATLAVARTGPPQLQHRPLSSIHRWPDPQRLMTGSEQDLPAAAAAGQRGSSGRRCGDSRLDVIHTWRAVQPRGLPAEAHASSRLAARYASPLISLPCCHVRALTHASQASGCGRRTGSVTTSRQPVLPRTLTHLRSSKRHLPSQRRLHTSMQTTWTRCGRRPLIVTSRRAQDDAPRPAARVTYQQLRARNRADYHDAHAPKPAHAPPVAPPGASDPARPSNHQRARAAEQQGGDVTVPKGKDAGAFPAPHTNQYGDQMD